MALALSSFELQKRYWYFWNQETKMHQLSGGHMGLGSKPILRATLLHYVQKVYTQGKRRGYNYRKVHPQSFKAAPLVHKDTRC